MSPSVSGRPWRGGGDRPGYAPELSERTPWGLGHILLIAAASVALGGLLALGVIGAAKASGWLVRHRLVAVLVATTAVYGAFYLVTVAVIGRTAPLARLGYRPPSGRMLLGVLALVPAWYGVLAIATAASALLFNGGQSIPSNATELFGPTGLAGLGRGEIALTIAVVAGVVPLVEETFFRGVLYQWLRGRLGIAPAVVLSAFFFAAAHLVPLLLPVLFVMGCVLALVFQRTGSLFASILLHGLNNALTVVALVIGLNV